MKAESHEEAMEDAITIVKLKPGEFITMEELLVPINKNKIRNKDLVSIEMDDDGCGLLIAKKVD